MTLLVANNFVKMKAMRYNGEWRKENITIDNNIETWTRI